MTNQLTLDYFDQIRSSSYLITKMRLPLTRAHINACIVIAIVIFMIIACKIESKPNHAQQNHLSFATVTAYSNNTCTASSYSVSVSHISASGECWTDNNVDIEGGITVLCKAGRATITAYSDRACKFRLSSGSGRGNGRSCISVRSIGGARIACNANSASSSHLTISSILLAQIALVLLFIWL